MVYVIIMEPGRELERFVAFLEKVLGSDNVKIKSPDYLMGKLSESQREVDVSIRGKIGSSEIFVIAECRDRKDTEDVRWIEQIATKRNEVGADKAIAVSSFGFTDGAIKMAKKLGIRLMILDEVDPQELRDWMQLEVMRSLTYWWNPLKTEFSIPPPPDSLVVGKKEFKSDDKVFRRKKDGTLVSLNDIWAAQNHEILCQGVTVNGDKVVRDFTWKWKNNDCFQWATSTGGVNITKMHILAEIWIVETRHPITSTYRYQEDGKPLVDSVRIDDVEIAGEKRSFLINMDKESRRVSITLDKKDDDSDLVL